MTNKKKEERIIRILKRGESDAAGKNYRWRSCGC